MNLNCSANNCTYNQGGSCYASNINISGHTATSTCGTNCSSFIDKSNSAFTNGVAAGNGCPASTNSINCDATNCKHNSSRCCVASSVQINANDASCETFVTL